MRGFTLMYRQQMLAQGWGKGEGHRWREGGSQRGEREGGSQGGERGRVREGGERGRVEGGERGRVTKG